MEIQDNAIHHETLRAALVDERVPTVLVTGPPGSGKTWLTASLAVDAATACPAHTNVLVLTFTVNAADQITREIRRAAQRDAQLAARVVCTNYHALYRSLLRAYVRYWGVPRTWRTWPQHECDHVLRHLNAETEAVFENNDAQAKWQLSNAMSIADALVDVPISLSGDTVALAAGALAQAHQQGLLHYDSWAYFCHTMLHESDLLRRRVGGLYPVVFVDEFQDTNGVEWRLLNLLAAESQLVCMADPDQSIYSFKGANPLQRLADLRDRRPGPLLVRELTEQPRMRGNPRLAQISTALRQVCHGGRGLLLRREDPLRITPVDRHGRAEPENEAGWEWPRAYCAEIKRAIRGEFRRFSSIGVLAPTWSLLGCISDALLKEFGGAPQPHALVGTDAQVTGFLSTLTHCLEARLAVVSPDLALFSARRDLATLRIMTAAGDAARDWFDGCVPLAVAANHQRRRSVLQRITVFALGTPDPGNAVAALPSLSEGVLSEMQTGRGDSRHPLWLGHPYIAAAAQHWLHALEDYVRRNPACAPRELLHAAWSSVEACAARERRTIGRARVLLMTAHAAKGKEFDVTFLCGASRGTANVNVTVAGNQGACDAVRNLLYVAASRSRHAAVFLHKANQPCCLIERLNGGTCINDRPRQLPLFDG